MKKINLISHPIVVSLITKLRDKNIDSESFRIYANRVSTFLIYEALRDIETSDYNVTSPTGANYEGKQIEKKSISFLTILRAGLAMFVPAMEHFPHASFHTIGLKRNENNPFDVEPEFYLDKLKDIKNETQTIIIVDPMLATGGTMLSVLRRIKKVQNYKGRLKIVSLIAAKYGVEKVHSEFPEVEIICAGYDLKLNENGYIIPGLGDAGDRYFGN